MSSSSSSYFKSYSKPSISSSSPSRAEKFQPPPPTLTTRFLRTSVSSRSSRGGSRSLSSPMFSSVVRKKKKSDIETQEPTSPKVTCMGQVRVGRRSSTKASATTQQNPATTKTSPLPSSSCNKCLQRVLFCSSSRSPFSFSWKKPKNRNKKKKPYNPSFWHRCFSPFYNHRKVLQVVEHSSRRDFKTTTQEEQQEAGKEASNAAVEKAKSGVFALTSPPKNALLLMRCRSAPYRSGNNGLGMVSLSLSPATPTGKKVAADRAEEEEEEEEDEKKVAQLGASSRPLILTRCKSEPASMSGSRISLVDRRQTHVFFD